MNNKLLEDAKRDLATKETVVKTILVAIKKLDTGVEDATNIFWIKEEELKTLNDKNVELEGLLDDIQLDKVNSEIDELEKEKEKAKEKTIYDLNKSEINIFKLKINKKIAEIDSNLKKINEEINAFVNEINKSVQDKDLKKTNKEGTAKFTKDKYDTFKKVVENVLFDKTIYEKKEKKVICVENKNAITAISAVLDNKPFLEHIESVNKLKVKLNDKLNDKLNEFKPDDFIAFLKKGDNIAEIEKTLESKIASKIAKFEKKIAKCQEKIRKRTEIEDDLKQLVEQIKEAEPKVKSAIQELNNAKEKKANYSMDALDTAIVKLNEAKRVVKEAENAMKSAKNELKNVNDAREKKAIEAYMNDCLGPQSKYEIDVNGIKSIMDNTMCPFTFNCKNIYGESVNYANTISSKEYEQWGDLIDGIKCMPCIKHMKQKAKVIEQGGGGGNKQMIAVLIAHHKKSNKKGEEEEEKEEKGEKEEKEEKEEKVKVEDISKNDNSKKDVTKEKKEKKDDDGQSRCYCEPIKAVTSALLQIKQNKKTNPNCFVPYTLMNKNPI